MPLLYFISNLILGVAIVLVLYRPRKARYEWIAVMMWVNISPLSGTKTTGHTWKTFKTALEGKAWITEQEQQGKYFVLLACPTTGEHYA